MVRNTDIHFKPAQRWIQMMQRETLKKEGYGQSQSYAVYFSRENNLPFAKKKRKTISLPRGPETGKKIWQVQKVATTSIYTVRYRFRGLLRFSAVYKLAAD